MTLSYIPIGFTNRWGIQKQGYDYALVTKTESARYEDGEFTRYNFADQNGDQSFDLDFSCETSCPAQCDTSAPSESPIAGNFAHEIFGLNRRPSCIFENLISMLCILTAAVSISSLDAVFKPALSHLHRKLPIQCQRCPQKSHPQTILSQVTSFKDSTLTRISLLF